MKVFTVDLFENIGANVTGETEQHSFDTREDAISYCKSHKVPDGWRFTISEWENGFLIDMEDWEN